ncbi:hypothetical protein BGZ65_007691 [Modicella reniformis]|uniref:F-box domain-containing protein n=1 Tax=Modicella reniformis TaxID=1440133 RepID=A0A9P6LS51_9FUNG|nr:hypothetical protein BGZ65_007691 [Modicella reniformis]
MTESARSRVFHIPELLNVVASYLSPADILACVQVNSRWNHYFIPMLWHTIDDDRHSWERILVAYYRDLRSSVPRSELNKSSSSSIADGKSEAWVRRIFAKYGQYIRVLKLHWVILVHATSTSRVCTNLQVLEINLGKLNVDWSSKSGVIPRLPVDHPFQSEQTTRMSEFELKVSDPIMSILKDAFRAPKKVQSRYDDHLVSEEELRKGWLFTQHYWILVLANPALQRLHLAQGETLQWPVKSKEFIIRKVLSGMTSLKDLCVFEILDFTNIWRLHEIAPTVDTVTILSTNLLSKEHEYDGRDDDDDGDDDDDDDDGGGRSDGMPILGVNPAIKKILRLEIDGLSFHRGRARPPFLAPEP